VANLARPEEAASASDGVMACDAEGFIDEPETVDLARHER
jgi:hypothetical protein